MVIIILTVHTQGALPLVNEELLTPIWYAIHFPGTNTFGIIDFFAGEDGRNAHLTGKVAEALFASVDELLTGPPDVVKLNVLAAKISG
jgi:quinol monooxygenase YgiN